MTATTITPDLYGDLVETAAQPGFRDWLTMVRSTGGCAEPVHLWGSSRSVHAATGEVVAERAPGRLLIACGNRRRSRCPSCSETYRGDTFQLITAGLVGGKSVTEAVATHPKVFATFTAPSFGPVHQCVSDVGGRVQRCHPFGVIRCGRRHDPDDLEIGQPLDPDTYDYVGAVMWNALATRLWARTVQLVNRKTARLLGIRQRDWPLHGRVSVAKVAEYQARGLVHFHAIFRLDGCDPADLPPAGATVDLLCEAIRQAVNGATIEPPDYEGLQAVVWGEQLDLRPVTDRTGDGTGLTDGQVAGYLAKYATKGAEASGTIDRPLACRECSGLGRCTIDGRSKTCESCGGDGRRSQASSWTPTPHAEHMIHTCWNLGGRPELEHLRLRPWAHMLGFRGHFSTKTRRYSTTLGCLRSARARWREQRTLEAQHLDPATRTVRVHKEDLDDLGSYVDQDVVLVVGDWRYIGRGHSPGQALFAASVRQDLAEGRRMWRQLRSDEWEVAA